MKTCPVCKLAVGPDMNHRNCVLDLFKQDKIQNVKEWEAMCKAPPKRVVIKIKL